MWGDYMRPKFKKSRCKKCKYHGTLSGVQKVFCNYASLEGHSCIYRQGSHIIDKRGCDYENCLLFKKGKALRDNSDWKENNMSGLKNLGGRSDYEWFS